MFQGGDYPLVMDAPFATMDYFKKTLPRGLRSVVPQMVLISTNDQWSGEVEASLLFLRLRRLRSGTPPAGWRGSEQFHQLQKHAR